MRHAHGAVRSLVWLLVVAMGVVGCGAKPPYRVSEPNPPTREQLEGLGRIDLAESAGEAPLDKGSTPQIWIGVPDRRAEAAAFGAGFGGIAGAIAGALIGGSGGGGFAGVEITAGAVIGAIVGAPVGGVIGALLCKPSAKAGRSAGELRRHAAAVDVSSAARDGASRSEKLKAYREPRPTARPGATLSVHVVAYGTRAAGGSRAQPFVAIRTRLTDVGTGRVIYQSTSDWRGSRRTFSKWAQGEGADFRRELEYGARDLGRRSVDRALTPRLR